MSKDKPLLSRKCRIGFLRVAFIPLILAAAFAWRQPENEQSVADFAVEWVGYLFLLAGLGLRLWSILYVGGRKSKQLVTDGPYSICRNPLYTGTILLTIGAALCLGNIVMLAVGLMVMIPVHLAVTLAEERHLEGIFGEEFRQYKRCVPRFFGRPGKYRSAESIVVSAHAVKRAIIEASAILLIPVLGDLINLLHARGILPAIWHI